MAERILVIEDEPDFARFIQTVLEAEGFAITVADDGLAGLETALKAPPDLVLLDWSLPSKNGPEVCKALRADPRTARVPVILLTVRGRESDAVLGLEVGANDFITKRVLRPRELVARVRAALRVGGLAATEKILRAGTLEVDYARRRVRVDGAPVTLRPKEFELLWALMQANGRVLSRTVLTQTVWGSEYFGTSRTIDTTVGRVRAKLGKEADRIQSLKSLGYRFDDGQYE